MATGIESRILEGLRAHLDGLLLAPPVPVAWNDKDFSPTARGYLRANLIPNTVNQVTLGTTGKNRHRGLFQISVMWPKGQGEMPAREIADSVAEYFKRGTDLTHLGIVIRIYRPPVIAQTFTDGMYSHTPVTISYQVDADNPSRE